MLGDCVFVLVLCTYLTSLKNLRAPYYPYPHYGQQPRLRLFLPPVRPYLVLAATDVHSCRGRTSSCESAEEMSRSLAGANANANTSATLCSDHAMGLVRLGLGLGLDLQQRLVSERWESCAGWCKMSTFGLLVSCPLPVRLCLVAASSPAVDWVDAFVFRPCRQEQGSELLLAGAKV